MDDAHRSLDGARRNSRAEERLALLLEANEILSASLDYETTLANVAHLAATSYCDWCIIHLVDEYGGIRLAALAHADPAKSAWARELAEDYPLDPDSTLGISRVIRTGSALMVPEAGEADLFELIQDPRIAKKLRGPVPRSYMIVPLKVHGAVLGALTLTMTTESMRRFTEDDLVVVEDLARRAAVAIDHARLYRQSRRDLHRLVAAQHAGHSGSWEWRVGTDELIWCEKSGAIHGFGPEDFDGSLKAFMACIHPLDLNRLLETVRGAIDEGRPIEVEYRIVRPDGAIRWIWGRGEVVERSGDGSPLRFAGICTDITEKRLQEERLIDAVHRFEAIMEASPLPIALMDTDARVIEWNPAAERLTGWSKEEVIGRKNPMSDVDPDLIGPDERLYERLKRRETIRGLSVRRRRRDGTTIDLSKWAAPVLDVEGQVTGFMAIYTDNTERTRFLRVAAHELGNPLSTIRALGSLIAHYCKEQGIEGRIPAKVRQLQLEVDRFAKLLDEILTAFRSHEGRLPLEPVRIDLDRLVAETVERLPEHERVRVRCACRAWVYGDPRRLSQVFENLLNNAVKYSPPESAIEVTTEIRARSVVVAVRDQGIGIPRDELDRIFEEFYRVERLGARDPGGMGLGLSVCREIVQRHSGRIWAESDIGAGSTFYVELPIEATPFSSLPA